MPKRYQFNFSGMTIAHAVNLTSNDMSARWLVVHQFTVGGVLHLPAGEHLAIWEQFQTAYNEYMRIYNSDAPEPEPPSNDDGVRGMLDDIEGL